MKVLDVCYADQDLNIRLNQIIEDSRCPENVICVWPGRVGVELDYEFQLDLVVRDTLYLEADAPGRAENQIGKYHFQLKDVRPYPQNQGEIQAADYRIDLRVFDGWFNAQITGYDMRLCPAPCCGGLIIEFDDRMYVNYNYEEISGIVLDNPAFPIPIRMRYTFDKDWPCVLVITELE